MRWTVRVASLLSCLLVTPLFGAQLSLSWQNNAGNQTGYAIERRSGSDGYQQIATVDLNATAYIDTSVTTGQAYCYRVRAFNNETSSGYSNEACGTASGSPPSGQVSFSVSGTTTSPSAIARGQSFNLTTTVKNTGTQSINSAIVNIEIKDPNGTKLLQDFTPGQSFGVGQSKQLAFTFSVPSSAAPGSYFADVSVYDGTWSPMYTYQWHAAALTVTTGTVPSNQPTFVVNAASAQPSPVTRGQN